MWKLYREFLHLFFGSETCAGEAFNHQTRKIWRKWRIVRKFFNFEPWNCWKWLKIIQKLGKIVKITTDFGKFSVQKSLFLPRFPVFPGRLFGYGHDIYTYLHRHGSRVSSRGMQNVLFAWVYGIAVIASATLYWISACSCQSLQQFLRRRGVG